MLKFGTWYDNEWGFSNRMIELVKLMGKWFRNYYSKD
jgi:glyceraldehyde-3-phosphate dehydrogenase/erythrose-4-phosphate dehydrogenase